MQMLGFRPPFVLWGTSKKIGIAYVVWESVVDVGFATSAKVWREKKRNALQIIMVALLSLYARAGDHNTSKLSIN